MSKKRYRIACSFLCLLMLWQAVAMQLDNEIILPGPWQVAEAMISQIQTPLFFSSLESTLMRVVIGFMIAMLAALIISFLSYFYEWFADGFYPILLLTRSIPNISYILIVLFWFSAQLSVIIISFLILFPTMYASLFQGLQELPREYQDVMRIYPGSKWFEIKHVYIPYLRPYVFASTSAGISLAFKVGIMAEILGQAGTGIGRQLNICRLNLDMAGVFAWTVWIILLLFFIEKAIKMIYIK